MDYLAAFDISASGMAVEKYRLDVVALNLANANSTRGVNGELYQPLRVISGAKNSFANQLDIFASNQALGAEVVDVRPTNQEPRMVFDPSHPDADTKGYVAYPNVNTVSEMMTLIEATRAYEANVKAMNAARSMALQALDIGRK